jgi:hypothetical protein
MTESTRPIATGGMSPAGTTTTVRIAVPEIDPLDKKVLCAALCTCDKAPAIGKDGQKLKQQCVSTVMKEVDKQLDHLSPYKQEINYDMTKNPPEPIMDKDVATKGHDWLPGWIEKYFGQGRRSRRAARALQGRNRPDPAARCRHREGSQQATDAGQHQTDRGDEVSAG